MEHKKQWEFLKNKFEAGQLAHAYLFSGAYVLELVDFSKKFVSLVNNKNAGAKDLPIDLLQIASAQSESSLKNEKDMMEIDVDQIRALNNFLSYKSYYGGYKAVIIENAERMNLEAQSCLLKTLEEPKGQTIIFLISTKPETLMTTIFSRCQALKFFSSGKYKESSEEQKKLQELISVINSDLAEKFQYAKKSDLQESNFGEVLEILQRYFRNLLLFKIGAQNDSGILDEKLKNYSVGKIKKIIELIEKISYQLSTSNASSKLALEILLIEL